MYMRASPARSIIINTRNTIPVAVQSSLLSPTTPEYPFRQPPHLKAVAEHGCRLRAGQAAGGRVGQSTASSRQFSVQESSA